MNSEPKNRDQLRLRVSTVLILIALSLVPFSHFNVQPFWFPATPEIIHKVLGWLYFELSIQLFFVAFFVALLTAVVLGYRRQWRGLMQGLIETGICFAGVLLAPAY